MSKTDDTSRPATLDDHRPLELSEDAQHLEHGSARGCAGIKRLLMQEEVDTRPAQFL